MAAGLRIIRGLKTARIQRYLLYVLIFFLAILFWFSLPRPLFNDPLCTVLLDRGGNLLGAKISADQQWRFPESAEVPEKFSQSIIHYEDRYFLYHPGFNPFALVRAVYLNLKYHRVVSGGSTISMQVAVDTVGAGNGDTVLVSTGSSARSVMNNSISAVDAAIVGIVETIDLEGVSKAQYWAQKG